jgi:hypothetical protein
MYIPPSAVLLSAITCTALVPVSAPIARASRIIRVLYPGSEAMSAWRHLTATCEPSISSTAR